MPVKEFQKPYKRLHRHNNYWDDLYFGEPIKRMEDHEQKALELCGYYLSNFATAKEIIAKEAGFKSWNDMHDFAFEAWNNSSD